MTVTALRLTLRRVRSFHEDPVLIGWWAARVERASAWVASPRRRLALSLGGIALLLHALATRRFGRGVRLELSPALRLAIAAPVILALFSLCYLAAVCYERLPAAIRRRPQVALHALVWGVLAALWVTFAGDAVWRQALILLALFAPLVLWRCGYLLKSGQRGKAKGTAPSDHLFYLWPVWGGTATPYGKGLDYLERCDAQSPEAFARSQLAGLKLILLAGLCQAGLYVMSAVVYGRPGTAALLGGGSLGISRLGDLVGDGPGVSLPAAWASLYCALVWETLKLSVDGHWYIGLLRLCGFNVFRNTYKPLLAESVVEFWNRYYYYFKELLVEFFFYPTFSRCRVRPWLRTLLAVFAAAFAGNLYYHLIARPDVFAAGGAAALWDRLSPRVVYCCLLAAGIYVSMLREQRRRGRPGAARPGTARRLWRIGGVWTFYSLIHLWNVEGPATVGERFEFMLGLFLLR